MNDKGIQAVSAGLIAAVSIATIALTGYMSGYLLSLAVFLAGASYGFIKKEPLIIIVCSEILVVNNNSFISMLLIQLISGFLFFTVYISKKPRYILSFGAVFLIVTSFFAYGALTLQTAGYLALCVAAIVFGYAVIQMHWRKNAKKQVIHYEN